MQKEIESIFSNILLVCAERDLLVALISAWSGEAMTGQLSKF
jgi:hypothetical protein